ncbi:MAG: cobalamin B12-binding domain-containing protein, partial [Myxococcota bacterium]
VGAADGLDADSGPRFKELADETEVRLRYLSAALASGAPELFTHHVVWTAQSWHARGVSLGLLERSLEELRQVLAAEIPEASVVAVLATLDRGIASLGAGAEPPASVLDEGGPQADRARHFLLALLEKRRGDARDVVFEALDAGVPLAEVHRDVVARAQREMGRLWQLGEVHIGEEHLGSRIVEEILVLARERAGRAEPDGRCLAACSTAGDLHDLGARMVSDALEVAGWESAFLGANVPAPDLARSLRDFEVDLLVLSVGLALHVRGCAETIAWVREELGPKTPPIVVGGPPFEVAPDLWCAVGADACAESPVAALAVADRLVPQSASRGS